MESVFFSVMGSESQMAPLLMLASNCLKRTWRMNYGNSEVKGSITSDTAKPLCSMHSRMVNQTLQGTSGREMFTYREFKKTKNISIFTCQSICWSSSGGGTLKTTCPSTGMKRMKGGMLGKSEGRSG